MDDVSRQPARIAKLAIALGLLVALAIPAIAFGGGAGRGAATDARRLSSSLAGLATQAGHRLRPPAARLARALPADAEQIEALREPAATTEAQLGIALDQLQQMRALTADPHYTPTVIAVGRAYVAATGHDPLTATAIDPSYAGLGPELAGDASGLRQAAGEAGDLSARVKRLSKALSRERRRAARLEREIRRMRTATGAPRR
jgi:hypothetical protein